MNCLAVLDKVAKKEVPLKPVLFALKALKEIHRNTCKGKVLHNGCMVMVADLDQKYQEGKKVFNYRHPAVFINLCVGDKKRTSLSDVIFKTFTNRGTGSMTDRKNPNYTDDTGIKTTLAGVFFTNDLTAFHPYSKSVPKYRKLLGYKRDDKRCRDSQSGNIGTSKNGFLKDCPVIRLGMSEIGVSKSVATKPMHTSPFKSSSGCPSLKKEDNWIMRHLASYESSLYIAYTEHRTRTSFFDLEARCGI